MSDVVKIPLWGGLDTKTDAKEVGVGRLTTAQNVFQPNGKRWNKRYGQTQLGSGIANTQTSLAAATAMGTRGNELLLFNGSTLYTYGSQGQNWISKGSLTEIGVTASQVVQNSATRSSVTSLARSGVELYAWEDSRGGIRYSVRDQVSQSFYIADVQIDALGVAPQIVFSGNFLNLFYGVGGSIYARQLSLTNPSAGLGAATILATDYQPLGAYGVTSFIGGTNSGRIVLAYVSASLSTQINVYGIGGNLVVQSTALYNAGVTVTGIGVATDPTASYGCLTAMANGGGTAPVAVFPNTMASFSTATAGMSPAAGGHASVTWTSATSFTCYYDEPQNGSTKSRIIIVSGTQTAGVCAVGAATNIWGLRLAAHAFTQGGQAYVVGVSPANQVGGALSAITAYYVVGSNGALLFRTLGGFAAGPYTALSQASSINSTTQLVGLPYRLQLATSASGAVYATTGLTAVTFAFPTTSRLRSVEFNGAALLNCGNTYSYDSQSIVEAGFWEFPEGVTATTVVDAASSLSLGVYNVCVVYEWTDAQGNIHRSAPSYPAAAAVFGGRGIAVTAPPTALTRRQAPLADIDVAVYRTLVNSSGPYYREGVISNAAAFTGGLNVSFACRLSDADLQAKTTLYAPPDGSGEVENDAPPPFLVTVATKTRVFGIPQEDQTAIWFSKPLTPGRPAEFSAFQTVRLESAGGNATALGSLDDRLAIFKQSRVYVLPGDGPDASGQGGYFSFPKLLSTATGCNSAVSVVSMDRGLMFMSPRGIDLLDRSESLDLHVGQPVDAYKSLAITGAAVEPVLSQVRFFSSTGTSLVYDTALNLWSTYSNWDCVGALYWNGGMVRAKSNGEVWQESSSTFLDGVVGIPLVLETGWIHPAEMAQGYLRMRRMALLGDYKSSHLLNIDIAYDYKDYAYTITWNPQTGLAITHYGDGTPYGGGVDQVFGGSSSGAAIYQLRMRLPVQKCQAVRFRIRDSQISGESCTLSQIALELEAKGGLIRLPAGQTL